MNHTLTEAQLKTQLESLGTLRSAIAQAIVGQESVVEQLLIGLLAGGHCLLEGVPGLGKTLRRNRARAEVHSSRTGRSRPTPATLPL